MNTNPAHPDQIAQSIYDDLEHGKMEDARQRLISIQQGAVLAFKSFQSEIWMTELCRDFRQNANPLDGFPQSRIIRQL